MSALVYFSIVEVADALRGTPDYRKVVGVCPAAVTHWELGELVGNGISLDGIFRVLRKAEVKRVPVREEEPGLPSSVLVNQLRDFCDIVLRIVDLPCCAVHCQCDQGSSSSLGGVVGTSEPNGEVGR
ncbi:hypothetical protein [Schaalia sp.]|uniref:hypothetical protein n=1 Tax=Schaalia sp. TaxID=2691890 RepID=UPI003D1150B3